MKKFCVVAGLFIMAVFSGCGEEKEKILTVCTEAELKESAQFIASAYQKLYPEITFNVEMLPSNEEEREAVIKKIQTQTMAGEGPDIFLLPTKYGKDNIAQKEPVFDNINKVMAAKVFLDLNTYMEKDKNFQREDYQEAVFQAGQYDKKQYLLPLSYSLQMMYMEKSSADTYDFTPLSPVCGLEDLKNKAENTENPAFQYMSCGLITKTLENYLSSSIDYKNQSVSLEEKEILKLIEEESAFLKNCPAYTKGVKENMEYIDDKIAVVDFKKSPVSVDYQQGVFTIPQNEEGKVLGEVCYYAAVSRSCSLPEEAYRYVMLFLDKNFQAGKEMELEKGGQQGLVSILQQDIPVCKTAWDDWFMRLSNYQITDTSQGFESFKSAIDSPDGAVFNCAVNDYTNSLLQPMYQGGEIDCEAVAKELYSYYSQTAQE